MREPQPLVEIALLIGASQGHDSNHAQHRH